MKKKEFLEGLNKFDNPRAELHERYKYKMKDIIADAFANFCIDFEGKESSDHEDVLKWIDQYVESRFIPNEGIYE